MASEDRISILCLNDDCLLEIFKRLELATQVRLALLCHRLHSIFQTHSHRLCKILRKEDFDAMTQTEMKYFFTIAGRYVKGLIDLQIKPNNEQTDWSNWVIECCPNVRKVYFEHARIRPEFLQDMLVNMRHIKSLELLDCPLDSEASKCIAKLSNLEYLRLERVAGVTACHFSKLKHLKELSFVECNLKDKNLISICKSATELRKLEVVWCEGITDAAISKLAIHCSALQILKISCFVRVQLEALAQLPSLYDLEVVDDSAESLRRLFRELALRKSKELKCLRINGRHLLIDDYLEALTQLTELKLLTLDCSTYLVPAALEYMTSYRHLETISLRYCKLITDQAVFSLIKKCNRLKHINLMCCELLTEKLVFDAINLLQEQRSNNERTSNDVPVVMLVVGTRIDQSILSNRQYLNARALLRLSFVQPFEDVYENRYKIFMPKIGDLKYFY